MHGVRRDAQPATFTLTADRPRDLKGAHRDLAAGHLACGCANFTHFMNATRISGAAGTLEMCGYI